jgi:hypothetical protein
MSTIMRRVAGVGRGIGMVAALVLATAASPKPAPPAPAQAPGAQPLDRLISGVGPLCLRAPAAQCVDKGFAYADRDRNGRLSVAEAQAVESEVSSWAKVNAGKLPPEERQRLVVGVAVVQTVGVGNLFATYDANNDGSLTKEEVLADVRLDQRPLPQVLSDPKAVDWEKLAGRAGSAAPLLRRLFPL